VGRGSGPVPFPCGFASHSPRSPPIPTLPADGDGPENNKTQGTSWINPLRQSSSGPSLFSRPFAAPGRCRQSGEALWILPSRAPRPVPPLRNAGCEKSKRRNQPVPVLPHTVTPRREQPVTRGSTAGHLAPRAASAGTAGTGGKPCAGKSHVWGVKQGM